jgi:hypothetical protein
MGQEPNRSEAMCTHIQDACHLVTLTIETMGHSPASVEYAMCDNCLEQLAHVWDTCSVEARYAKFQAMKDKGLVRFGMAELHDKNFADDLKREQIDRELAGRGHRGKGISFKDETLFESSSGK